MAEAGEVVRRARSTFGPKTLDLARKAVARRVPLKGERRRSGRKAFLCFDQTTAKNQQPSWGKKVCRANVEVRDTFASHVQYPSAAGRAEAQKEDLVSVRHRELGAVRRKCPGGRVTQRQMAFGVAERDPVVTRLGLDRLNLRLDKPSGSASCGENQKRCERRRERAKI